MNNQSKVFNKDIGTLIGILIVLVAAGLVTGGLYYYLQKQMPEVPEITEISPKKEAVKPGGVTSAEIDEIIKLCKGKKEKIKHGNTTLILEVEKECYLVEAAKTGEKIICEELKETYNKCVCRAVVDFLSQKSEAAKKEIIGDIERPYHEISEYILANSEVKTVIDGQCPLQIEELIESCRKMEEPDASNCYLMAAIDTEKEIICDEFTDDCSKCACHVVVNLLSQKSEAAKKEIIGDRMQPIERVVENISKNPEIKTAIEAQCSSVCPQLGPEAEAQFLNFDIILYMNQIIIEAHTYSMNREDYTYTGFSCEANETMSSLCKAIEEKSGARPTIYAQGRKYCAYIKLLTKDEYYCVDNTGKGLKTTINPSRYCNDTTFVCPPSE